MDTSSLIEQILSSDNLNRAYLQVVRNKDAEGVDGMKYTELKEHLAKNGEIIKEQLGTRKYKPQPVAEWSPRYAVNSGLLTKITGFKMRDRGSTWPEHACLQ